MLYNSSIYLTDIFQVHCDIRVLYIRVVGYRRSFKTYDDVCDNKGMAQKLSKKALIAKRKRDLAEAMTPRRRKMKAENQRKRRAAIKAGKDIKGKDYDHNRKRFVSVKTNRSKTKTTNNTKNKK